MGVLGGLRDDFLCCQLVVGGLSSALWKALQKTQLVSVYPLVMTTPEQEHVEWQAQRLAALTAADGWLSLIGLEWLEDGEYAVGSAVDCKVRLEAAPPYAGVLRVAGGTAAWYPTEGPAMAMETDAHGSPTTVAVARYRFLVIERDGRLAMRIKDPEAPTRRDFRGIDRFPFDPAWILRGSWDGEVARFKVLDQACILRPQRAVARPLQFVFADRTSGRETYGGGRFLFATPAADGQLALDFNRAINPPCVFTPFATCPLPTRENRLPMAVTAGERYDGR